MWTGSRSAFSRFPQARRASVDLTSVMANSHAILLVAAVTLAAIFIGSAEAKKSNCPKWYKDCNPRKPGCETCVERDVNNCGDCGYKCKTLPYAWAKCEGGHCRYTCKPGRGDCDKNIWSNGCETNINNDANNCGCCGKPCKQVPFAETRCLNGKCYEPVCKTGYANCDKNIWSNGCETCVARDVNNCGACGNVCKQVANAVTSCQDGKCGTPVCKTGWSNCDGNWENGCETATGEDDAANCGACRNVCTQYPNAVTSCQDGKCGTPVCKAGWSNCDGDWENGCETATGEDAANCGACRYVCTQYPNALTLCQDGKCGTPVCNRTREAGWGNCDGYWENGCETPISNDAANCGHCGYACEQHPNAVTSCVDSKCGWPLCKDGWADCDQAWGNGCETDVLSDVNHCHYCGNVCPRSFIQGMEIFCSQGECGQKCPSGQELDEVEMSCVPVDDRPQEAKTIG